MSGHRHEVESEIVLPAGMELVVPPPANDEVEPTEGSRGHGTARRPEGSERAGFSPYSPRRELGRVPVT